LLTLPLRRARVEEVAVDSPAQAAVDSDVVAGRRPPTPMPNSRPQRTQLSRQLLTQLEPPRPRAGPDLAKVDLPRVDLARVEPAGVGMAGVVTLVSAPIDSEQAEAAPTRRQPTARVADAVVGSRI
jgi:hypothetical protein